MISGVSVKHEFSFRKLLFRLLFERSSSIFYGFLSISCNVSWTWPEECTWKTSKLSLRIIWMQITGGTHHRWSKVVPTKYLSWIKRLFYLDKIFRYCVREHNIWYLKTFKSEKANYSLGVSSMLSCLKSTSRFSRINKKQSRWLNTKSYHKTGIKVYLWAWYCVWMRVCFRAPKWRSKFKIFLILFISYSCLLLFSISSINTIFLIW